MVRMGLNSVCVCVWERDGDGETDGQRGGGRSGMGQGVQWTRGWEAQAGAGAKRNLSVEPWSLGFVP